jgi:hypothetical protein
VWDLRKDREPLYHASGAHMSRITAIDWSHTNPKEFITSAGKLLAVAFFLFSFFFYECRLILR